MGSVEMGRKHGKGEAALGRRDRVVLREGAQSTGGYGKIGSVEMGRRHGKGEAALGWRDRVLLREGAYGRVQ
jgi:hypothetical protein